MPSRLNNLFRNLAWADFKGKPPPGTPWAAMTRSFFTVPVIPTTRVAGGVELRDEVVVNITFDGKVSWRVDMSSWPSSLEQELLEHEQGHHDITALNGRDLFIQLMQMKGTVYPNETALRNSVNDWIRIYNERKEKIQKAYDDDTGHSQANVFVPSTSTYTPPVPTKSSTQQKWERLIKAAFNTPRVPPESAPDGTPYKKQLVNVLLEAGITLP